MRRRLVLAPNLIALLLFFGSAILFMLVAASRSYVPSKFLYDEGTLRTFWNTTLTCVPWTDANGYVCTAIIYRTFGVTLEMAIGISAVAVPCAFLLIPFGGATLARPAVYSFLKIFTIAFAWAAASAIFNSGLNKELLAMLSALAALYLIKREKFILASAMMVFYGLYIRPYWVIVVVFSWLAHLISKRFGPRWGLITLAFCLVGLTLFASVVLHNPLSLIREGTNADRVGSEDARSIIVPFFDIGNPVLEAANMFVTWVLLIIPAPLLLLGSIQQLVVAFLVPVTFYMIFGSWRVAFDEKLNSCNFACSMIFAFITVQAIFEPDYGSFTRHLSGFIPFGLLSIGLGKYRAIKRASANRTEIGGKKPPMEPSRG